MIFQLISSSNEIKDLFKDVLNRQAAAIKHQGNELFDEIFGDAIFMDDFITKIEFVEEIEDKLSDDQELRELLIFEWEHTDVARGNKLTTQQIRQIIINILKREMLESPLETKTDLNYC